jgi:hypothetical protein
MNPIPVKRNRNLESELHRRILALFGGMPEIRLFRANVGMARPLSGGPPIRYGTNGQADLIGWVSPSGRFLGIEVKSPTGQLRPEQKAWGAKLEADGGIYVVARSTDDVFVSLAAAGVSLRMAPPGLARATVVPETAGGGR